MSTILWKELSMDETYLLVVILWSECDIDEDGNSQPLDYNFSIHDIEDKSMEMIIRKYREFKSQYFQECLESIDDKELYSNIECQFAQDYWLSCNGHGSGFFDSIWSKEQCQKMQALARQEGSYYAYSDNGIVYIS